MFTRLSRPKVRDLKWLLLHSDVSRSSGCHDHRPLVGTDGVRGAAQHGDADKPRGVELFAHKGARFGIHRGVGNDHGLRIRGQQRCGKICGGSGVQYHLIVSASIASDSRGDCNSEQMGSPPARVLARYAVP